MHEEPGPGAQVRGHLHGNRGGGGGNELETKSQGAAADSDVN